jgi:hypothetical protein
MDWRSTSSSVSLTDIQASLLEGGEEQRVYHTYT